MWREERKERKEVYIRGERREGRRKEGGKTRIITRLEEGNEERKGDCEEEEERE